MCIMHWQSFRSRFDYQDWIVTRAGCLLRESLLAFTMSEIRFVHLPKTRNEHFKLYFHAAVLDVLDHVTRLFNSSEAALQQFPFLAGYQDQLAGCGLEGKLIDEGKR